MCPSSSKYGVVCAERHSHAAAYSAVSVTRRGPLLGLALRTVLPTPRAGSIHFPGKNLAVGDKEKSDLAEAQTSVLVLQTPGIPAQLRTAGLLLHVFYSKLVGRRLSLSMVRLKKSKQTSNLQGAYLDTTSLVHRLQLSVCFC